MSLPIPSPQLLKALRTTITPQTQQYARLRTSGSAGYATFRAISASTQLESRNTSRRPQSRQFHSSPPRNASSSPSPSSNDRPTSQSTSLSASSPSPTAPLQASPLPSRATVNPYAPTHRDRGPPSKEDTQTDFGAMDVLGHIAAPATSVDACTSSGFHLDNGVKTEGGLGILLVGGEAFTWEGWAGPSSSSPSSSPSSSQPSKMTGTGAISDMLDTTTSTLNIPTSSLGLLELLHPKPDLLIVGTGARLWTLGKEARDYISGVLGCRLEVLDTPNAAASYNLLAKERGIDGASGVGALLLPAGWVGPKGRAKIVPKRGARR